MVWPHSPRPPDLPNRQKTLRNLYTALRFMHEKNYSSLVSKKNVVRRLSISIDKFEDVLGEINRPQAISRKVK